MFVHTEHRVATPHPRSASSAPSLRVLRELCVKIAFPFSSTCKPSNLLTRQRPSPNFFPCHTSENLPSKSNHCHTSKTAVCNPFVCHTSETPRRVFPFRFTLSAAEGISSSPLNTLQPIQVLSFRSLPNSFAPSKNSTPFFLSDSALFAKNIRGLGREHEFRNGTLFPRLLATPISEARCFPLSAIIRKKLKTDCL